MNTQLRVVKEDFLLGIGIVQCVVWVCLIFTINLCLFADAFLSFLQYSCNIERCHDTRTHKMRNLPVICWLTDM